MSRGPDVESRRIVQLELPRSAVRDIVDLLIDLPVVRRDAGLSALLGEWQELVDTWNDEDLR